MHFSERLVHLNKRKTCQTLLDVLMLVMIFVKAQLWAHFSLKHKNTKKCFYKRHNFAKNNEAKWLDTVVNFISLLIPIFVIH